MWYRWSRQGQSGHVVVMVKTGADWPCVSDDLDRGGLAMWYRWSRQGQTLFKKSSHIYDSNLGRLRPRIGGPVTSMMLWPLATTNCGALRP